MRLPYCIGLTGGIGSGKSSAAEFFRELGAAVIDTDEISHDLTRPGGAAIPFIRATFGDDLIAEDGALHRERMRKLVFSDPEARTKLEGVLHPLIRNRALEALGTAHGPYAVLVVPLLFETGAYGKLIDRVLVVDCGEALQVARASARGGMNAGTVRAIMAAQVTRQQRLAAADDVIRNDGSMDALRRQVKALHADYLRFARGAGHPRRTKRRKTMRKVQ
jgi:dephospho-CoA kinase